MVYVTKITACIPSKDFKFPYYCRLVADSIDELYDFAIDKMKLKKEWYRSKAIPHFDLGIKNRRLALELGALEISPAKEIELLRKFRI